MADRDAVESDWATPTVGATGDETLLRLDHGKSAVLLPPRYVDSLIRMLAASQGWTVEISKPEPLPEPEPEPTDLIVETKWAIMRMFGWGRRA